ncbi:hypothetical protein JCM19239_3947 [Vibrio variabilis]|uniref:Exopolysaccharide biosynthesis protein YbjH n=1 Tax=Vibrio variabilis TaxID=990271 RepID=A0ABQ0J632_9VIBR|nr:hypothetical protein JCM19239_3947 [Vibrio variabilis]
MEFCVQQRCGRGVIKLKPTYVTVSLYLFGASIIHQSVFADELVFERVDNFNTSMAQTGGTGLLRTPHAEALEFGQIFVSYNMEQGVDNSIAYHKGAHNTILMGLGILPHVEFVVQNSHKDINGPPWQPATGSDLSFSAKIDASWFIPEDWFQFALGVNDFGGEVSYHSSYYAVFTKQLANFRLSAGLGHNSTNGKHPKSGKPLLHQMGNDYLSGPFGGIEYQPWPWMQLVTDYDGTGVNAGVKLFTPSSWLPYGAKANLTFQAFSDSSTKDRDNQWFGAGLSFPLAGSNNARRYARTESQSEGVDTQQLTLALEREKQIQQQSMDSQASEQSSSSVISTVDKTEQKLSKPSGELSHLESLATFLADYGFENVSVGSTSTHLVVKLENNLFNRNEIDAIGVVLGFISERIIKDEFRLTLLNNNLPVVQVSGTKDELHRLFQGTISNRAIAMPRLTVSTDRFSGDADVTWQGVEQNDYRFKPKVILSPSLYSNIGTEWGVFDYSLALSTNVQVPVWSGGLVDVRHMLPLSHSDDFDDGRRFGNSRHTNTVDRILFHQGLRLPAGIMAQASVGQIATDYQGGTGELRWQSPQGTHKFGFEASYYQNKHNRDEVGATPILGHYRYYFDQYDWAIEANAGQYWEGDKGFTLTSKHWFGDTAVSLYFQHTDKSFAGLNLSFPLSFRKSMKPAPIQIRGIEQWTWGYRTMVGEYNALEGTLARTSDLQNQIDRNYYNRDRLSAKYINANLTRLKDAYLQFKGDKSSSSDREDQI